MFKLLKKSLFLLILFTSSLVYSENECSYKDFVISVWLYQKTEKESIPGVSDLKIISRSPSDIFFSSKWKSSGASGVILEGIFPEYEGILFCSVCYEPFSDDGEWVSSILNYVPEELKVSPPEELSEYENSSEKINEELTTEQIDTNVDNAVPLQEILEENDSEVKEEQLSPSERRLLNSEKELRLFEFGEEKFSVDNTQTERITITALKNSLVRKYFNDEMRMIKRETWQNISELDKAEITKTEYFTYGESPKPIKSSVVESDRKTVLYYDEEGRLKTSEVYLSIKNDENKDSNENKEVLSSRTEILYDSEGRLISKKYFEYEYFDEDYRMSKAKVYTKTDSYKYKNQECPPDYYYYENEKLRMKTIYTFPKEYVSTLYFDGGFVVESYYLNGNHTKDLYYSDGILRRKRIYE